MRVRRKKRTKRLIVLLSLLLLGIVGFRNILPNLGDVFQYHHVASGEYGWNLILVNRDNYIPDDYTVELTELSNGQKVDSRIYPSLQEMFDAARAEGLGLFVADGYRTAETQASQKDYPAPATLMKWSDRPVDQRLPEGPFSLLWQVRSLS